jgi:hypothetical protein
VSVLASHEKFHAIVPDLANRPRQLVFLTPIDSQLNDFLNEIHQIVRMEPSIVERIDEDLDLHAKKKKLQRLADERFLAGQTADLPKLELQLRELKIDDIELETGRPRTEAYIVYLFLMLRGWCGGCKDQHARLLLEESMTLKLWLELKLYSASSMTTALSFIAPRCSRTRSSSTRIGRWKPFTRSSIGTNASVSSKNFMGALAAKISAKCSIISTTF